MDKENATPNVQVPTPSNLKRKAVVAPSSASNKKTKAQTAPGVQVMACNLVKAPAVLEVEDADILSVDDLFKLRFVSNKFDYKARLAERSKYTMFMKDRLKMQAAEAEQKEQEQADQIIALEETIESLHECTTKLEEELTSLQESKTTSLEGQEKAVAALAAVETSLNHAKSARAEKVGVLDGCKSEIRAATDAVNATQEELAACKATHESLQSRHRELQEYNAKHAEYNTKLQADLTELKAKKAAIEEEAISIQQRLSHAQMEKEVTNGQLQVAKAGVKNHEAAIARIDNETQSLKIELGEAQATLKTEEAQVGTLQGEVDVFRETHGKTQAEFDRLTRQHNDLQEACAEQATNLSTMKTELSTGEERLLQADSTSSAKIAEFTKLQEALEGSRAAKAALEKQRLEGEKHRRELNGRILDLKGNLRVFCRVATEGAVAVHHDDNGLGSVEVSHAGGDTAKSQFGFDKQFAASSTQAQIFQEASGLVRDALDGFKVGLLSYGPDARLNRHTLFGGEGTEAGILPRTMEALFARVDELKSAGWDYHLELSFVEVNEEATRDLGKAVVVCKVDADAAVNQASMELAEGCQMVGTLHLTATKGTATHTGLMTFAQLSGAEGDASLKALGDVVAAMQGRTAVPFKASKLTQLLQPVMEDHAKTVFFANVSGEPAASEATLETLKFVSKVNACHIGRPRKMKA